jgi:hypothetical protein
MRESRSKKFKASNSNKKLIIIMIFVSFLYLLSSKAKPPEIDNETLKKSFIYNKNNIIVDNILTPLTNNF